MEDNTPPVDESQPQAAGSAVMLRDLEQRARNALSAQHGHLARLEDQITRQLETIAAALADDHAAEADGRQQIDSARADAEQHRLEAEAARADVEKLRHDAEHARTAWQAEKTEQETTLAKLRDELKSLRSEQAAQTSELATRSKELDARQTALDKQTNELAGREVALRAQAADSNVESELARTALERERDELAQKFELALQDVQRFRARSSELEQELARRPEASQTDSAELVSLRAERDALAERIEHLERQPTPHIDADAEQHFADLQRRFELAVEDVRELKTKNAELEARLLSSVQRPTTVADGGGMDWESQKRRLLASLEESGEDSNDPLPERERLTIENTIEMTDAVVAEKDREIERLKAELSESNVVEPADAAPQSDHKLDELLNADEVIAEHRKRIGGLEREMEDKLRAAELELSVERAKLAREKADLEELRDELAAQRQSNSHAGGAGVVAGTPRRRWLSKLGLSGDEQG